MAEASACWGTAVARYGERLHSQMERLGDRCDEASDLWRAYCDQSFGPGRRFEDMVTWVLCGNEVDLWRGECLEGAPVDAYPALPGTDCADDEQRLAGQRCLWLELSATVACDRAFTLGPGILRRITFGDLVLSVLPWPFHKDLPSVPQRCSEDGIAGCQFCSHARVAADACWGELLANSDEACGS